ncbi:MAG: PAS domain S-box protein, partial [Woeseiaceae bacterium]
MQQYAPPCVLLRADGSIRSVHGAVENYLDLSSAGSPAYLTAALVPGSKDAILDTFETTVRTHAPAAHSITRLDGDGRRVSVDIQAQPVAGGSREGKYYLLSFVELPAASERQTQRRGRAVAANEPTGLEEARQLLSMRRRQQAAVARFAALARTESSADELLDHISEEISQVLGVDFVEILEYDTATETCLMVAGSGWPHGVVGRTRKPANLDSLAGYTLCSKRAVIVSDFEEEKRFSAPFLREHGVVSGVSVPIGPDSEPWGVLGVQSKRGVAFTWDDANFLLATATLLWSVIQREFIQSELRGEQMRTHALISNTAAFAWMKDTEGRYAYVSPNFEKEFGIPAADWIGMTDRQLLPAELADKLQQHDRAALEADAAKEFVEALPNSDGGMSTFLVSKFPFTDARGGRYVGGVAVDISERAEAERELERSRAELQQLIDSATIGIAFATADGHVLKANDAMLDIFSVSRAAFERPGEDSRDTVLPLDRQFAEVMNRLGQSSGSEVVEIRRRDAANDDVWVLASAKPSLTDDNVYVVFVVDITPQKKAELALAASEKRFRFAADTAEFGTYFADLDRGDIVWSPETAKLFGREKSEELTTPIGEAPEFVLERDRSRLARKIRESLDPCGSGRLKVEFRVVRPSGAQRWLVVKGRTVFGDGESASRPLRMAGFVHDITQQKRLEKQLRSARTAAEAANIAKSQFLANMSHEIRTPMTSILGFAEILSKRLDGTEEKNFVEKIHENGVYLCNIIDDVLDLSKIEAGKILAEHRECDIASVVAQVFYSMEPSARHKDIELELRFDGAMPRRIVSDPIMIRQILLNIVGNAVKYTSQGAVTITVGGSRAASEIRFGVRDSGPGIDKSRLQRVFEPFEQGAISGGSNTDGTGLGLSISKRLIEALGGALTVESRPGEGSLFSITLPTGPLEDTEWLSSPGAVLAEYEALDSTGSFRLPNFTGHTLVVDDNEDIRYLVTDAICAAGGTVT